MANKKKRFIILEEITKRVPDIYYGVCVDENKDELTCICTKEDDSSDGGCISKWDFDTSEWKIEDCRENIVQHHFRQALRKSESKLIDAEFSYEDAKFDVQRNKEHCEKFFIK
jgi:hypothetical protein